MTIELLTPLCHATSVISIVLACYDTRFDTNVSVPPHIAMQPDICKLLEFNRKRPLHTTSTNIPLNDTPLKQVKLTKQHNPAPQLLGGQSNQPLPNLLFTGLKNGHIQARTIYKQPSTNFTTPGSLLSTIQFNSATNQTNNRTNKLHKNTTISSYFPVSSSTVKTNNNVVGIITSPTALNCNTTTVAAVSIRKTSISDTLNSTSLKLSTNVKTLQPVNITSDANLSSSASVNSNRSTSIEDLLKNIRSDLSAIRNKVQDKSTPDQLTTLQPSLISVTSSETATTKTTEVSSPVNVAIPTVDWSHVLNIKQEKLDEPNDKATKSSLNAAESSLLNIAYPSPTVSKICVSSSVQTGSVIATSIPTSPNLLMSEQNSSNAGSSSFQSLMQNLLNRSDNINTGMTGVSSQVATEGPSTSSPWVENTTIEGEPTKISDLPSNILEMLHVFNEDARDIRMEQNRVSLVNEQGSGGNVCGFLLGKVDIPKNSGKKYFSIEEN